ncbi:hypothetical protein CN918_28725 [Priestia megaterium]|nr:hypothetical protein CN918_28725 [Priestia megaterium]
MEIEKMRRKLTDEYGETKMRSVWKCRAKIGTHSSTTGYFFDKPEVGVKSQFIRTTDQMYTKAIGVIIEEIDEEGLVRAMRF